MLENLTQNQNNFVSYICTYFMLNSSSNWHCFCQALSSKQNIKEKIGVCQKMVVIGWNSWSTHSVPNFEFVSNFPPF